MTTLATAAAETPGAGIYPEFPPFPRVGYPINAETIVHLARPVAEFIHTEKPDAIIAADRGGRLLALGTHAIWKWMYPEERFPTRTGGIHFARLSRRKLSSEVFGNLFYDSLRRAKITCEPTSPAQAEQPNKDTRVTFMDDWIWGGETLRIITDLCGAVGIAEENVTTAVMVDHNDSIPNRHVVGDPDSGYGDCSWLELTEKIGMTYTDGYLPKVCWDSSIISARRERQLLNASIQRYFSYDPSAECST